jgi:phosphoserine phosphatase RsbU/P
VSSDRKHHLKIHREDEVQQVRPTAAIRADEVADCLAKFSLATGWGIRSTARKEMQWSSGEQQASISSSHRNVDSRKDHSGKRWEVISVDPMDGLLDMDPMEVDINVPAVSRDNAVSLLQSIEALVARVERAERAVREQEAILATDVSITRNKDESVEIADRLESILATSSRSIQACAAAIYLLDEATTSLKMRACWNLPVDRLMVAPRQLRGSLADLEAMLGNAVLIEDTAVSASWPTPENFGSAIIVPIGTASMPQGTIWFWSETPRKYEITQVEVANMASGRVMNELEQSILGNEVQQSRLVVKQLEQASAAQTIRWPDSTPMHDDFDISGWTMREGSVGGAFHDWDLTSSENLVALFGNAGASGVQGAIVAGSVHAMTRSAWMLEQAPNVCMQFMNDYLLSGGEDDCAAHATLLHLDCRNGRGSLSNAGNNQMFIVSHRGFRPIGLASAALGTNPMSHFQLAKFVLQPGELLIGLSSSLVDQLNLPSPIRSNDAGSLQSSQIQNRIRRERRALGKSLDQHQIMQELRHLTDQPSDELAQHFANRLPILINRDSQLQDRSMIIIRNIKKAF